MNRRFFLKASTALAAVAAITSGAQTEAAQAETLKPRGGVTLPEMAQAAQEAGQAERATFIRSLADASDLLGVLPFMSVAGGAFIYLQEGQLPGVAFFDMPETYHHSAGVINPALESLKVVGGDLDVDVALIKTHGPSIRPVQERVKAKNLGLFLTEALINGDGRADPRLPIGLKHRIIGPQHLVLPNDPLSRKALDKAIESVDGPTHLLAGKRLRNRMAVSGWLEWGVGDEGQRIAYYTPETGQAKDRKLRILCANYNHNGDPILDYDEPRETTSLYVLSLDTTGVCGLQNGAPEYDDLGEVDLRGLHSAALSQQVLGVTQAYAAADSQVVHPKVLRSRAEWLATLGVMNGRSAARISGIAKGPVRA